MFVYNNLQWAWGNERQLMTDSLMDTPFTCEFACVRQPTHDWE